MMVTEGYYTFFSLGWGGGSAKGTIFYNMTSYNSLAISSLLDLFSMLLKLSSLVKGLHVYGFGKSFSFNKSKNII